MADVRRPSDDRRERGQLILVTGLAVAVTLVALVLLLNTVIYTQNLATRGAEIEDREAQAYRQEVRTGVGSVVDAENREEYHNLTLVRANVTDGIVRLDRLLSRYHAERGAVVDVNESTISFTNGTLLRQTNASRDFSAAGNDAAVDWTLANDTQRVRAFETTVSRESLTDSDSPTGFSIRLVGDSNVWRAYVYNETDGDGDGHTGITVAVKNGTEEPATAVCSASGSEATIDLTAGTVNGTACPGLVWAKGIAAPYDVQFRNASNATGTYSLTVDVSPSETNVKTANFAGPNDDESPRAVPAVYAAAFEIHFETTSLAFHTDVRVAPGEPE